MNTSIKSVAALGAALALLAQASLALADTVVATGSEHRTVTGPDRDLLRTGVWTLGLSYTPALIVAIESQRSADKSLYVPVAGPWIDFATRDCPTCAHETTNKVLLVTDGLFQGIGALQIVGSLLFVETRSSATMAKPQLAKLPRMQLAPVHLADGYGLSARGTF